MKTQNHLLRALRRFHLTLGLLVIAVIFAGRCGDLPLSHEDDSPVGGDVLSKRFQSVFKSPFRIESGPGNTQFVSDFLAGEVYQVMATGGVVTQIKSTYAVGGFPAGVAYSDGLLYVGDWETGQVRVVEVSRSATGARTVSAVFEDPTDMAADSAANRLYVLDGVGRQVHVVDTESGQVVGTISSEGLGDGELQNPKGIALNPVRQEVMVSDFGDLTAFSPTATIKVFGYDGAFRRIFRGKQGWFGGARFSRINGMTVDESGRIYVVESLAGEVQVLDPDTGETQMVYGTYGTDEGDLWLPLDVVLNNAGDLVVTNNRARTVEVLARTAAKSHSATYTPEESLPAAKTMALIPQHQCSFCHSLHGAPGDRLLIASGFENVCMTCHGPSGTAVQVENHTYPTSASPTGYYSASTCIDCHVPHDNEVNRKGGTNRKLVRAWVEIETVTGLMPRPITFENRGTDWNEPTEHSFCDLDNDGDGVWDSPCDTCHNVNLGTNPGRHRWNSPDTKQSGHHNNGRGCTNANCHAHIKMFDNSNQSQG